MASTLRKKLTKRHAVPDLNGTTTDEEGSSTSSSSEDLQLKLTGTKEQSIARNDLRSIPSPPERGLGSRNVTSSVGTSPSQTLLFRYKKRSAAKQVVSKSKAGEATAERVPDKDAVFNKPLDVGQSVTSAGMNEPPTQHYDHWKETKVVDGVEFEMVDKKRACEAPSRRSGNKASVPEPRQTRSQTRRQQRVDSHSSGAEPEVFPKNPSLTIRTVQDKERTPSPLADTDAISTTNPYLVASTPTDESQHQLTPSPQTSTNCTETILSRSELPTPSGLTIDVPKISSYRRSQQNKAITGDIPPTRVIPPMFRPHVPAGYLWVSSLGSSSRPSGPWGWMKKWTCCQCAELDPFERDQPAETIVEQKVCARLECGHERCPIGCRILPDPRYDVPGVFG